MHTSHSPVALFWTTLSVFWVSIQLKSANLSDSFRVLNYHHWVLIYVTKIKVWCQLFDLAALGMIFSLPHEGCRIMWLVFLCMVCLSSHVSKTTQLNFTIFLCMLPVTMAQSFSGNIIHAYGFVDDILFSHNGPFGTSCIPKEREDRLLVEQGLTSHQTHYRSYRGRVFMGQMTQPTVSKHWRKLGPKD